ncbi:MAG: hypothetical protein IH623_12795 [Verrucomicrobia bacterium]|nr:hypothetical protein [Verrucomicrobiota bacterium]
MKLTQLAPGGLSQTKAVPGLLHCQIEYEVKTGTGTLDYIGPKFSPAMWQQVLAFFRWTYEEMASESQVRLYVNPQLGRWGAWAFPQEARTGLSAREIATPETPEQAIARFASWEAEPSADWFYFGTVHHHCQASAFQSGTDEANERNQDGLHLTVGRMDAERHELHARFYLAGNCFTPDLNRFWAIAPDLAARVPVAMHDELARFEMGEPVVVTFPEAWRQNVIEVKPAERRLGIPWDVGRGSTHQLELPDWMRADDALQDIAQQCEQLGVAQDEFMATLTYLGSEGSVEGIIVNACLKHRVTPEEIVSELQLSEPAFY